MSLSVISFFLVLGFFSSLFARYNFYSSAIEQLYTALVLSSKMASSANTGPWYEPARQRGYFNFGVCFGFPIGFPLVFPGFSPGFRSASAVARSGRRLRHSWPAPRRYSRRGSGRCWGPGSLGELEVQKWWLSPTKNEKSWVSPRKMVV